MKNEKYRFLSILFTAVILFVVSMTNASAVHAESVWAMGGPLMINVQTGSKNYSNHTQWVSSIYLRVPTTWEYNYGCGKFEAWTQNFYVTSEGCGDKFYYISKWVSSGNGVCGAFTPFNINKWWPRTIACISIKV